MADGDYIPPVNEDESVHSFFARKFGAKTANELVPAIVAGIFAGDPKLLSVRSCFPDLVGMEAEGNGSVGRAYAKRAIVRAYGDLRTVLVKLVSSVGLSEWYM